jgi:hypothetical protein
VSQSHQPIEIFNKRLEYDISSIQPTNQQHQEEEGEIQPEDNKKNN